MQTNLFNKSKVFANPEPSWATPPEVFELLDKAFGGFWLDVCANESNAKCKSFISPERDTLDASVEWVGPCWMNPPYGEEISLFLEKANRVAALDAHDRKWKDPSNWTRVVALLPTNFESAWFRQYCEHWPFLIWPQRIQFIHPDGYRGKRPANGNVVVAFGYQPEELPTIKFWKRGEGLITLRWFIEAKRGAKHA